MKPILVVLMAPFPSVFHAVSKGSVYQNRPHLHLIPRPRMKIFLLCSYAFWYMV